MILAGSFECHENYLDLSVEWGFKEDLSYFDSEQLDNIIEPVCIVTPPPTLTA